MKEVIKRVVCLVLVVILVFILFTIVSSCSIKAKQYKYLTYDNEWGISNNCYLNNKQQVVCKINNELVNVVEMYEEE